jgi:hypothetical protein
MVASLMHYKEVLERFLMHQTGSVGVHQTMRYKGSITASSARRLTQ